MPRRSSTGFKKYDKANKDLERIFKGIFSAPFSIFKVFGKRKRKPSRKRRWW